MSRASRNALIGIVGLILLVAPMLARSSFFGNRGTYEPPQIEDHFNAATPIPTVTAVAQQLPVSMDQRELRSGPVVVDLAHFNFLDITKFQPLSSALAQRGIGTRFWLPVGIDAMEISSFLEFPDQSEKLAAQLEDASGLVIVSPFFLWSPKEIEIVTAFVADGGRLLLISDPDTMGDLAQTMNLLAEPYGVVFNDDYLYNTDRNDENFTYTFQGGFSNRAADLEGSEIVFYGARSIVGAVEEQIRSSDTTLSSSRKGITGFTTVAIGGLPATETADRVLAMSDFDVLSEPFVDRYDNAQMVNFVADFMAGGGRTETLVDFPGSLGKEVALVYGTRDTVDAELITISAKLQQRLERSGRDMELAQSALLSDGQIISSTQLLTGSLASLVFEDVADAVEEFLAADGEIEKDEAGEDGAEEGDDEEDDEESAEDEAADNGRGTALVPTPTITPTATPAATSTERAPEPLPDGNVIYLADFETAGDQKTLLSDAGFTLIHVARTPTPTPTEEPTSTPTLTPTATPTVTKSTSDVPPEVAAGDELTGTVSITGTSSITGTASITDAEGITGTVSITGTGLITGSEGISATVDVTATDAADIGLTDAVTAVASITSSITETVSITDTAGITDTESMTETEEAEPLITAYLISDSGLQLLASETVLIVQQDRMRQDSGDDDQLIAVLGESAAAINAGVERLLARDFADCIIEDTQVICPFVGKDSDKEKDSGSGSKGSSSRDSSSKDSGSNDNGSSKDSADSGDDSPTPTPTVGDGGTIEPEETPDADSTPEPGAGPISPEDAKIVIVDDNGDAADGESSEAEFYMETLTGLGANPAIWSVADSGTPPTDLLVGSDWLIWSSAGYADGGPTVADLDPLFEVLNEGGRITISSQNTFFGQTQDEPSQLTDIQITSDVPVLTNGLPDGPITLVNGGISVAPIQANTDENPSLSVVMRRGPDSEDADEPVLFILVDDESPEATGARLMVLGMSLEWLPTEVGSQLVENMMDWVLE